MDIESPEKDKLIHEKEHKLIHEKHGYVVTRQRNGCEIMLQNSTSIAPLRFLPSQTMSLFLHLKEIAWEYNTSYKYTIYHSLETSSSTQTDNFSLTPNLLDKILHGLRV